MMYSKVTWSAVFALCTFMYGAYGPLVQLSQVDGRIQYESAQVVLLNELIKLFVNLCFLYHTPSGIGGFSLKEAAPYMIPALCYFFNNNSSLHILSELDPATFSILSNLKILTTTILYVMIMRKYPNMLQMSSLLILLLASTIHSYGTVHGHQDISSEKTSDSLNTPMSMKASVYGVTLLLLSISMTSFAAVFTEKTLKQDISTSIYKQNSYLYMGGVVLNLLSIMIKSYYSASHSDSPSLLTGFNIYTWIIIINTASQGFCVSFIMKYSTNITRLVLTCASLVVSTSLSVLLFNLQLNSYFIVSACMVVSALVIYNIGSRLKNNTELTDNHKPRLKV